MKILYFGFYDKNYSRNRSIIQGLESQGVLVTECNVHKGSWKNLPLLLWKYLKISKDFDTMIVGFPGQETMLLARLLTRKPIIFDAFTSHFGGYILDRKKYAPKSLKGYYYWYLDKISSLIADKVLLDTRAHVQFFVSTFNVPAHKFEVLHVGTDDNIFQLAANVADEPAPYLVHFHGNFIPLQGVEHIIEAAALLKDHPIQFQIIGKGQTFNNAYQKAKDLGLSNIHWMESVAYDKLPGLIEKAHLCLGIFGDTPKSSLVIPNKVYEYAAMGKPILTADTKAIHEVFENNKNIFLCSASSPRDLADKILYIKDNKDLALRVAKEGAYIVRKEYNPRALASRLIAIIQSLHE